MTDLNEFIDDLPVAELHTHIEGTFEPELMFEIARRNNVDLPYATVDDLRAAYKFNNLSEFIELYLQGMNALQTEQDYYDLTRAYMARCADDNVMHTEIFFDPQGHTMRGVAFETVISGITHALHEAQETWGISSAIIMCFLRDLPESEAFEALRQAEPHLQHIIGVGLDNPENGNEPSKFKNVFAAARDMGLKAVAHAGEEGPPAYVYEALDDLKVDRIDHGNRSLEDAALTKRLIDTRVPLTVCPLSNLALCGVPSLDVHPLKRMLDMGVMATVNSDDPAYFGGYVKENFRRVAAAVGLTKFDLIKLAGNSIEASFVSNNRKIEMRQRLNQHVARYA